MSQERVFIGTSSGGRGIYTASFDTERGLLTEPERVSDVPKPSWLRFAENGSLLTTSQPSGDGAFGEVIAFAVNADGKLTQQSSASTGGQNAVAFDERDGVVVAANYISGSAASFQLSLGGLLTPETLANFDAAEHGPDPKRQDHSYAHDATFSPCGNFVFINDLGCDRIRILKVDRPSGKLSAHGAWLATPGDGPRHVAVHPNGVWVYNINEIGCTIDQLAWDAAAGTLTTLSTVRTLPPGVSKVDVRACEVVFGKDLRFLYASNRVHEDFVVYAIHPETGGLLEVQRMANPGKESRHIAIDPTGRWLLSANQFTEEVLVFPIDEATGFLQPTVSGAAVKSPSCILFG